MSPRRAGPSKVAKNLDVVRPWLVVAICATALLASCAPAIGDDAPTSTAPLPTQVVAFPHAVCTAAATMNGPVDASTLVVTCPSGTTTLTVEPTEGDEGSQATYLDPASNRRWRPSTASIGDATCSRADGPLRLGAVQLSWTCGPRSGLAGDPTWDGRRFDVELVSFTITAEGFRPVSSERVVPQRVGFDQVGTPR